MASPARFARMRAQPAGGGGPNAAAQPRRGASRGLIPLVHTVRPLSSFGPVRVERFGNRSLKTVRSLMRTVLRDTNHQFTGGLVRSPVLLSRASGRSLGLNKQVARRLSSVITSPRVSARALACARRQIRREVILATGRGGGRHRPPSYRSNWRC